MTFVIIYLIGAILSFFYLTGYLDEPYEVAIVTAVFYPVLLVFGILLVTVTFIAALVLWLVMTVKNALRSMKNAR
jgi:hypothetical protein